MSEIKNAVNRSNPKWYLLTSVPAITLIAALPQMACAGGGHPTVWIEIGSQLERLTDGQEAFAPPFVSNLLENPFTSPAEVQRPPRYSFGQEARVSVAPNGTDWVFSAALRYGRANSSGNRHEETSPASGHSLISIPTLGKYITSTVAPNAKRFATTAAQTHSAHLVLDFQAGRDLGIGAFGLHGVSVFSAGVRFAQFTSRSKASIDTDPDFAFSYKYRSTFGGVPGYFKIPQQAWNLYGAKLLATHSFTGVGPTLAWDANATLLGNSESSSITFDWGLNGALLFGRQKAAAHHTTTAHHGTNLHGSGPLPTAYPTAVHNVARSHAVAVPNIGGFAGLSLRFPNAKVSIGYRADAFFGAMDGGIDARKIDDRDFYGPFATISIGLGD